MSRARTRTTALAVAFAVFASARVGAAAPEAESATNADGATEDEVRRPKPPVPPKAPKPPTRVSRRSSPAPAPTTAPSAPPAPTTAPKAATKPLTNAELEAVVRAALAAPDGVHLPRGMTLTRVNASLPIVVPAAATTTTLELTPPPRRPGTLSTTAVLVFMRGDDILARAPVTIELLASKDAAPEVPKGTPVVLLVQRDGFEITTPAVTSTDGDVGEVVSVILRASGRSFRARLASRERAVVVEGPR